MSQEINNFTFIPTLLLISNISSCRRVCTQESKEDVRADEWGIMTVQGISPKRAVGTFLRLRLFHFHRKVERNFPSLNRLMITDSSSFFCLPTLLFPSFLSISIFFQLRLFLPLHPVWWAEDRTNQMAVDLL